MRDKAAHEWGTQQTVKQVWFPGAHADVGGGYEDSKLSEAPLEWIYNEARLLELNVEKIQRTKREMILHQQRTANPLVGCLLQQCLGEASREALSTTDPGIISSMGMDQTARDHLDNPIKVIHLMGYPPPADETPVKKELAKVDDQARRLLRLINNQAASVRRPGGIGSVP